ncbi:MAG: hypothetical protein ACRDP9_16975 [Kribbellaceae bacterium]
MLSSSVMVFADVRSAAGHRTSVDPHQDRPGCVQWRHWPVLSPVVAEGTQSCCSTSDHGLPFIDVSLRRTSRSAQQ